MKFYTFSKMLTCKYFNKIFTNAEIYKNAFLKHPMYAVYLFPVCLHQNISFIRGGLFVADVYCI